MSIVHKLKWKGKHNEILYIACIPEENHHKFGFPYERTQIPDQYKHRHWAKVNCEKCINTIEKATGAPNWHRRYYFEQKEKREEQAKAKEFMEELKAL